MKKYSQIYSGKLPEFEDGDIFRTTIFLQDEGLNEELNEGLNEELNLSEKEKIVLDLMRRNGKITRASLAEKTGFSKATIDRLIQSLKKKGYIKGRTSKKSGDWIL